MSGLRRLLRRVLDAGLSQGPAGSRTPNAGHSPGPTPTDEAMMDVALACARSAGDAGEVPVGSVVYRSESGEVLSTSGNDREASHDPAGHAEMLAIRGACSRVGDWRLSDCTLVVTLEPCVMCAGAIVNARVGRVVYGAPDPKGGACESLYEVLRDQRLNHRPIVVPRVREAECAALLRDFFRALRRSGRSRDLDA